MSGFFAFNRTLVLKELLWQILSLCADVRLIIKQLIFIGTNSNYVAISELLLFDGSAIYIGAISATQITDADIESFR